VSEARFGKFEVVGFLGRGGMAEVFLCRLGGLGGFNKEVVVKRILPERVADPSFLRMFLDEARVAANLNHPNIVQVFEINEADGLPYIAMEYVRGPTFSAVIRETVRASQLHLGHVAKILSGVCEGLHHAHSALGPNREPLGLVHRDVSPQNIIVSPEGVPKLLDFGVAKARGRLTTTEAGTLKGKLRYMAPEQIQQGALDHRADVFSVGVLLCEATTGRNPFGARQVTEVQLFKNIVSGNFTKPSNLAASYPEELERIVLWAIEPDVEKRCPSAEALHDALEKFVSSGPYQSSSRVVAAWMNEHVAPKYFSVPLPADQHGHFRVSTPVAASRTPSSLPGGAAMGWGSSGVSGIEGSGGVAGPTGATMAPPARGGGRVLFAVGGLAALAAATLLVLVPARRSAPPEPAVVEKPLPEKPTFSPDEAGRAYLEEAERYARSGRLAPAADVLAKARDLAISDPGLNIRLLRLREEVETAAALRRAQSLVEAGETKQAAEAAKDLLDRDPGNTAATQLLAAIRKAREPKPPAEVEPPVAVAPSRTRTAPRDGVLTVSSSVPGMVYLDDDPIGRAPFHRRSVAPGNYTLQVRAPGHRPYEASIKVAPGRELAMVVPLVSERPPAASRSQDEPKEPAPITRAAPPPLATTRAAPVEAPAPPRAPATSPPAPLATMPKVPPTSGQTVERALGPVRSTRPKDRVPVPRLPRTHEARDAADLGRLFTLIENETISLAGVSREFAQGVTGPLRRVLEARRQLVAYPVGMYYFIVSEAARGHDKQTAAQNLVTNHENEGIRKLSALPARDRRP
jgi:serine/threonine protein kinase